MLFSFPRQRGKVGMGALDGSPPTPTLPRVRGRERNDHAMKM